MKVNGLPARSAPQMALVEWEDAHQSPPEVELAPGSRAPTPLIMRSVGWLVRKSRRAVVLATDVYPDGRARGLSRIPWGMVRRVVTLLDVIETPKKGRS